MTTIPLEENISNCIALYNKNKYLFKRYIDTVELFFRHIPETEQKECIPMIHTVKSRLKSDSHLEDKIRRKNSKGRAIDPGNLFQTITDLAGVRVLHLHQDQIRSIHNYILSLHEKNEFVFAEKPVAYSWDPESKQLFESIDIQVTIKDSFYTSVHYVIRPRKDADVSCEVQVRTLFEEAWGEIDHAINYPHGTNNFSCKEQLCVLSKIIAAGTRLSDAIIRTHNMGQSTTQQNLTSPKL